MKKYSEVFLNNNFKLNKSKIGFEFEFYMKDMSYYKTLEVLNQFLSPIKVHGFKQYHSDFEPDSSNFKIEPDLSGGSNMVELVTGPLPYFEAKFYLIKILKFIQLYGYTNEKSSIHFNISFDDIKMDLNDLNVLKLILTLDEDEIYRVFPSRKNNVYAKTIKKIIPFKEYDFFNVPIDVIRNNLRLPGDKYYGVNFLHINNPRKSQRLEFRYIGGKDYEKNIGQIVYFMDRFITNTYDSINTAFTNQDQDFLEQYLLNNINNFKNLSKYDNFIVDFPTISLQVDQNYNYDIINAYYSRLYPVLFELIDSTDSIKDCIINFTTSNQKLEIVDANIRSVQNIKNVDFVNCILSDGLFEDCNIINSEVKNSQIIKSKIAGSELTGTKVLNSSVEASTLNDCYFMNGYLNGDMNGGVLRSGKLGPYANVSPETKVVTEVNNFFDTRFDDEGSYVDKKGFMGIKGFKK